uniref:Uncharacterized protein n=1 Tax=Coccolithus braarudii TaxID=221442 RepID=A0A7S0LS41_9EUKA|mmetsp:Transcript_51649/g.110341  ORF Transcript_51649/g.110341 Transcript_51649/m.110341 type:complete len:205 (+) Transcript_51649:359-973(+)
MFLSLKFLRVAWGPPSSAMCSLQQPIVVLSYIVQKASNYFLSHSSLGHEAAPAEDATSSRCSSMLGRWVGQPHSSIQATLHLEDSGVRQMVTAYSAHDLQIVWQEGCLFAGYNPWARADGSRSSTEMITGELAVDGNEQRITILEFAEGGSSDVGFIQGNVVAKKLYISYVGALPALLSRLAPSSSGQTRHTPRALHHITTLGY